MIDVVEIECEVVSTGGGKLVERTRKVRSNAVEVTDYRKDDRKDKGKKLGKGDEYGDCACRVVAV